jgi:hypothetical protein
VLGVIGGLIALSACGAGASGLPGVQGHGNHVPTTATGTKGQAGQAKGDVGILTCVGAVLDQIAAVRSGGSVADLGNHVYEQLTDSAEGHLAFLQDQSVNLADLAGTPFSSVANVMAQSADPALRSCDYLLSDRPDDAPFITAAINAAADHGLVASAAALRGELQIVMVSDNPLRPGSLIVTMLIPGPLLAPATSSAPARYALNSIIVVMDRSGPAVTGVGSGRW